MADFWNFKDTLIVAMLNWPWLAVAFSLGLAVGWWASPPEPAAPDTAKA